MTRKLTYEYVKKAFEEEGYTLLSKEYINSSSLLEYRCPNGHVRKLTWNKWQGGRRCPYCSEKGRVRERTIEEVRGIFAKEGYKLLSTEYKGRMEKLRYLCPNNHEYETSLDAWLSKGNRCGVCSGNAKLTLDYIKKKFSEEGYTVLSEEYVNASTPINYICPNKHIGNVMWLNWYCGNRCLQCSGKERHSIDFIKNEFSKDGYTLLEETYINGKQKLLFKCSNNHVHSINWNNWQQGQRCYKCSETGTSKAENDLIDIIKDLLTDSEIVLRRNKTLIPPYELDIIIPEKKIAIEYCGLYWHSESAGKNKEYHLNKLNMCKINGYRLITIFEDEWVNNKGIVVSRLRNIIGNNCSSVVYARNCKIKKIDASTARLFCEEHHIQGYTGSRVKLGLFHNEDIIAVMTFSKPSISKGGDPKSEGVWELSRFCSKTGCRVVGGASKLLKGFERLFEYNTIISYADLRWSDGNLYKKLGFRYDSITKPNYWYIGKGKRIHRFALRKTLDDPVNMTEREIRTRQGWDIIWDCGNIKFKKERNNLGGI